MNDKAGIAANHDYGRDEDAAVKALKKHKVSLCHVKHLFGQLCEKCGVVPVDMKRRKGSLDRQHSMINFLLHVCT